MKTGLSLIEQQQMRDELHRARQMAQHMDLLIEALAPHRPRDFHDDSDTCPRCGVKHRGTGCRCSEG